MYNLFLIVYFFYRSKFFYCFPESTDVPVAKARLAAEDSINSIDPEIEGVRLAIVVTSLGGGTGGGVTIQPVAFLILKGS